MDREGRLEVVRWGPKWRSAMVEWKAGDKVGVTKQF